MKQLPEAFLKRMQEQLGPSYEAWIRSYEEPPKRGLRFNLKKARKETIEKLVADWHLRPVPWCAEGYYYEEEGENGVRPGKSPYHDAGVFYIQEPSAMLPAERAEVNAGCAVLDLCAAPGGKTTQAAGRAGFVLSNELIKKRALILSSNVERMGLSNVIVTSAEPAALSQLFPAFFDRVLVDAPCSGEGMMRRDETAVSEWSEENVRLCAERQKEILSRALPMVKEGGLLIYSTCTFSDAENREQTKALLLRNPELCLLSEEQLYPHLAEGEGHYCAVFRKGRKQPAHKAESGQLEEAKKRLLAARIPILRCGVEQGKLIVGKHKGERRYEPSHAEMLALSEAELSKKSLNLFREADALSYLRGESLSLSAIPKDAYALRLPKDSGEGGIFLPVCYDGYPMGAGKLVGSTVKNHYPKGLRRLGS